MLFLLLLLVPIAEIYVIVQVAHVLHVLPTLLLLIAFSAGGALLVRREGLRAWRRLTGALNAGRVPTREAADGAIVLLGGALLVTPGFLTDAAGLLLILPGTRGLARRALTRSLQRRAGRGRPPLWMRRHRGPLGNDPGPARRGPDRSVDGRVIDGEVVRDPPPD
ncbi:MAG TPA: FxsA family protein [Mycobacteriales bacterium]|nr:FxsA family protein [Mycobacteriales bacterium]